jgi:hypothetical protein
MMVSHPLSVPTNKPNHTATAIRKSTVISLRSPGQSQVKSTRDIVTVKQ